MTKHIRFNLQQFHERFPSSHDNSQQAFVTDIPRLRFAQFDDSQLVFDYGHKLEQFKENNRYNRYYQGMLATGSSLYNYLPISPDNDTRMRCSFLYQDKSGKDCAITILGMIDDPQNWAIFVANNVFADNEEKVVCSALYGDDFPQNHQKLESMFTETDEKVTDIQDKLSEHVNSAPIMNLLFPLIDLNSQSLALSKGYYKKKDIGTEHVSVKSKPNMSPVMGGNGEYCKPFGALADTMRSIIDNGDAKKVHLEIQKLYKNNDKLKHDYFTFLKALADHKQDSQQGQKELRLAYTNLCKTLDKTVEPRRAQPLKRGLLLLASLLLSVTVGLPWAMRNKVKGGTDNFFLFWHTRETNRFRKEIRKPDSPMRLSEKPLHPRRSF